MFSHRDVSGQLWCGAIARVFGSSGHRRRIRCDAGNSPDEAAQFARHRGHHDLAWLARRHHLPIAPAQPGLCLPGNLAHGFWHFVNGRQLAPGDTRRQAVAVRGLDQQGPGVDVTRLGDGADTALWPGGMFGWHQAEIGHEVGRCCEARWITNRCRHARAGNHVNTAQRTQVPHQREARPAGYLGTQIPIDTIKPVFGQAYRLDAFLQHDLLCWLAEALIGQPASVRLRPGSPARAVGPLVA